MMIWRRLTNRGKDSLQLSLAVSEEEVTPDQQHCEQEWSPSLGQENPELPQIKEEQEELRTTQEEEQRQGLEADIIEFKFTPSCVKSECDQEDPLQPLTLPQTQTVENRERDPKQVDLTPFVTVTHLKGLYSPCHPPDNQNNASSHSSAVSINPVGLDSSPPLDPSSSLGEHCFKPSTMSRKTHRCRDCGEMFVLKTDLQRHVTLPMQRANECRFCKKRYNSTCKLKAHVRLCRGRKPCTCPICSKTVKLKGDLSKHMRIHTGEKSFSCGYCGKHFNRKGNLTDHIPIHTGEKAFSCGDCGKRFSQKGTLRKHKLTHTGEKPFICGDCGKSFYQKGDLSRHIRTHTGEKLFICGDCGKSFNLKGNLKKHELTHTEDKPFSCDDCGKSFNHKSNLLTHVKNIHKGGKQDEN
ncbi:oocyte zinc finger protein XlCOF6.1-like isoform X2 [Coregonus clupeaformis]|uniref:oocyte zinc finger protein XlCOF6.1-like isoform X2 n=1 Tax=Coregonus clupeaformis TaxID=59861 RepID=UPI001E1C4DAE|nr:oocyte zinc finger protein XlCOF6.1-like isoform X2 [Coregonus clupeaformis]